ncbi:GILT-like protein 1 [Bicyclus anynana]|uniref:GILT-like protein 1 n=1 Tax=Bicyclus anynana TaxID=110368 RepID=A0ABM3LEA6_BICAN|nr:GILT-like protein 1 [Bicyclus anynana]
MFDSPLVSLCLFYIIISSALNTNASVKRYPPDRRKLLESENFSISRKNTVVLKVFYESLCPASADFFSGQLQPTVEALGTRVKVIMNPYGNAETKHYRGVYKFSCQHGPEECYGNKLHACAIGIIRNNTRAVFYNSCLLKYSRKGEDSSIDFTTALNWCGYKHGVPIRQVWKCAHSRRGANLLQRFGRETHKLNIKYVPYVMLGDSSAMQDQATGNLIAAICQMLHYPPPVCGLNTDIRSSKTYP